MQMEVCTMPTSAPRYELEIYVTLHECKHHGLSDQRMNVSPIPPDVSFGMLGPNQKRPKPIQQPLRVYVKVLRKCVQYPLSKNSPDITKVECIQN